MWFVFACFRDDGRDPAVRLFGGPDRVVQGGQHLVRGGGRRGGRVGQPRGTEPDGGRDQRLRLRVPIIDKSVYLSLVIRGLTLLCLLLLHFKTRDVLTTHKKSKKKYRSEPRWWRQIVSNAIFYCCFLF